jgi:hypothetical protein
MFSTAYRQLIRYLLAAEMAAEKYFRRPAIPDLVGKGQWSGLWPLEMISEQAEMKKAGQLTLDG